MTAPPHTWRPATVTRPRARWRSGTAPVAAERPCLRADTLHADRAARTLNS